MLTIRQYAAKKGVSPSLVLKLLRAGRLKGEKIGVQWLLEDQPLPEKKRLGRPPK